MLSKIADAAAMCWQSLDDRERMAVAYAAAWVVLWLLVRLREAGREQLKRDLLEELEAADRGSRV